MTFNWSEVNDGVNTQYFPLARSERAAYGCLLAAGVSAHLIWPYQRKEENLANHNQIISQMNENDLNIKMLSPPN